MAANVEKTRLIRFVDELDLKQIPVSVKKKKKEECSSGHYSPPLFPPRKHATRETRASKIRGRTEYHV